MPDSPSAILRLKSENYDQLLRDAAKRRGYKYIGDYLHFLVHEDLHNLYPARLLAQMGIPIEYTPKKQGRPKKEIAEYV